MTVVGLQVGVLLGGNMIVETVFAWPGLGRLVVRAIFSRDFPLVQGAVMVYAFTFVMANLIVSTTNNNEPMNRAVEWVARNEMQGQEITEGLLNHVEVAIRAYDPCLSCATHAVGQMPLIIRLEGADGSVIDERIKG